MSRDATESAAPSTIPEALDRGAELFGDEEAVVDGMTRWSFVQLRDEARTVAQALMASGVGPGDRVALWSPNSARWIATSFGVYLAGAVLVPVNTRFKGAEAAHVLRRSGARLRINAQLVDTRTDFPLWSDRFDREMKDVFEVQDEMARRIAEALRVTLSPEELEALAVKPTENLQAYDLYLRGKRYARRQTRQDLEFALQMFENAVTLDPSFALAYAASANACAMFYCNFSRDPVWVERAREASGKALALRWDLPEVQVSQAWVLYAAELHDEAVRMAKKAIERKRDCEGAHYLLCRALFAAGRYQEILDVAETAIEASGEDYNVYVPILNCLGAMGKEEAIRNMRQRRMAALENHLKQVPEDPRARILLGSDYAHVGRADDALRELNMAVTLRANEVSILYNAACLYCKLNKQPEAMDALRKAWEGGFRDSAWARRDPDLILLHDDPEFDRLYPEKPASPPAPGSH